MIVERRAEKRCDICNKLLAVKRFLFFKNVDWYLPIKEEFDGLFGDERTELHICSFCWMNMKEKIRWEIKDKKRFEEMEKEDGEH